jgi:hypothetical protein
MVVWTPFRAYERSRTGIANALEVVSDGVPLERDFGETFPYYIFSGLTLEYMELQTGMAHAEVRESTNIGYRYETLHRCTGL